MCFFSFKIYLCADVHTGKFTLKYSKRYPPLPSGSLPKDSVNYAKDKLNSKKWPFYSILVSFSYYRNIVFHYGVTLCTEMYMDLYSNNHFLHFIRQLHVCPKRVLIQHISDKTVKMDVSTSFVADWSLQDNKRHK